MAFARNDAFRRKEAPEAAPRPFSDPKRLPKGSKNLIGYVDEEEWFETDFDKDREKELKWW